MAPLSLKIIQDGGAVTRKVKLEPTMTVQEATAIVKEKALLPPDAKPYGLFLRSLDNDLAGIWLEDDRTLAHYLLRDGDKVDYMCKIRNLRLRMLDGSVKTLQVDQSRVVGDLMISICSKLAITNHEEYGLCFDPEEATDENKASNTGTLTTKKKSQLRVRDIEFEQLSKKLKTDDNVEWIDLHKTLSEACTDPSRTLLLSRRLYYSDRKVDSRDPVQLNLLYVQARGNILTARHPVTEGKAKKCKMRWINIRDMMKKKIKARLRYPKLHFKKYRYEKSLQFMVPHFRETNTSDELYYEENQEIQAHEKGSPFDGVSDDQEYKPILNFEKKRDVSGTLEMENTNSSRELSTTDPIDVFLLTVGSTLRKFSPYYLNQAKGKIFQIVQDYELEQLMRKHAQSHEPFVKRD